MFQKISLLLVAFFISISLNACIARSMDRVVECSKVNKVDLVRFYVLGLFPDDIANPYMRLSLENGHKVYILITASNPNRDLVTQSNPVGSTYCYEVWKKYKGE